MGVQDNNNSNNNGSLPFDPSRQNMMMDPNQPIIVHLPVEPMKEHLVDVQFLYNQIKMMESAKIARTQEKINKDRINAILIFCFGLIAFPLWAGGFAFLRSPSKEARSLGVAALSMFGIACLRN
ncbi:hypothetical protein DFA_03365 [Cavenderia fasciculata]|uniref:Transmembrane protein n=1 Tax=Cavenderia fasciculata TaxID=261658 RepID=F4PHD5_CACFS|nr:uncharacterized protein DFA_03365 [Cavenderia fasciculata]EGG25119.1 hypothetical protein DFA_03365 [Cavenderia fasciculata]|eukprot:XP_004362970.1 hypothetical protein DFA_03365 [Cavenderia fasciculata]